MNIRKYRKKGKKHNKLSKKSKSKGIFKEFGSPDRVLFGMVLFLIIFGLMMIYSAGILYATIRFDDSNFFLRNQAISVIIGFILLLILQRVDYLIFKKYAFLILIFAIGLLTSVFLPGLGVESGHSYTASRWINLGGFSFQPSEAVKLAIILYFSAWCSSKGIEKIRDIKEGLVPFLITLGIISFLILLQPDVGTLGIIVVIAMIIFFFAGANIKHLVSISVVGAILLSIIILVSPYRLKRVNVFLHPESDPLNSGYQIQQGYIAFGSGGLLGLGPGHSKQKGLYLPEPVGDSIYAIIGEEFGFVGTTALLLIFFLLLWRIFRIAMLSQEMFGRLVAGGIGVWVVGQAIMNMAAVTGLMPLTGIPLSFVSYGGSSIVLMLASIGILLNISRQNKQV